MLSKFLTQTCKRKNIFAWMKFALKVDHIHSMQNEFSKCLFSCSYFSLTNDIKPQFNPVFILLLMLWLI